MTHRLFWSVREFPIKPYLTNQYERDFHPSSLAVTVLQRTSLPGTIQWEIEYLETFYNRTSFCFYGNTSCCLAIVVRNIAGSTNYQT